MTGTINIILIAAVVLLSAVLLYLLLYVQRAQKIFRRKRPAGARGIVPMRELDRIFLETENERTVPRGGDSGQRDLELLETRMKFAQLQNQINPHFLYNTLENIRARALLDDNAVIADMTEALSRFFRYNISKRTDVVKLSEELDNIRVYMHIQQYRFSNKFDFQVYFHDGDPSVTEALIPKMTLQPIVENAIFHGMESKTGKGHIEIHIESDETCVFVLVEDDGCGMSPEQLQKLQDSLAGSPDGVWETGNGSDGIAMRNVNNRLKLFFGEECGITVSSTEGVGTEVELTLPRRAPSEIRESGT